MVSWKEGVEDEKGAFIALVLAVALGVSALMIERASPGPSSSDRSIKEVGEPRLRTALRCPLQLLSDIPCSDPISIRSAGSRTLPCSSSQELSDADDSFVDGKSAAMKGLECLRAGLSDKYIVPSGGGHTARGDAGG